MGRLILAAVVLASGLTACTATSGREGGKTPPVAGQAAIVIPYGQDSPRQFGELRVPAGKGPFPVAMFIHGGCYSGIGSPESFSAMADWFEARGVASWSISYRELGSNGGYPNSFSDWAAGLAKLKLLARTRPLDLTRLTTIGHSAGTTAATWLATGSRGDGVLEADLPDVRSAVVLDGPVGLAEWVGVDAAICGKPVIVPFMGGTPAEYAARYDLVDPRVTPLKIKELLVVDAALPAPRPDALEAIRARGVAVTVVTVSQEDHFSLLKPGHPDFEAYAPQLLRIVKGGQ